MRERCLFDLLVPGSEKRVKCSASLPALAVTAEPQTLERLSEEVSGCTKCGLRAGATQVVFGHGSPTARLMFVGEGPGGDEDRRGIPFVGKAGQLLDKILAAAEIGREEVYIANVVKCRPPANRTPQKDEVDACLPHLRRQIDLLGPDIIVCLGSLAAQALIDSAARVSAVRGRWFEKDGIRLMATFHPAALLRDPAKKRPVWDDFQKIRDAYRSLE